MLSIDTEEGRIEAENRNGPDGAFCILTFRERDSERAYPMCALVSCTHDSPDCWAYAYDVRGMHYDGRYLYLVEWDLNTDLENGYNNGYLVTRRELDGSDQKTVLALTDPQAEGTAGVHGCLFRDGKVYYTLYGSIFDPELGDIRTRERVCIGDLTTGEITLIPIDFHDGSNTGCLSLWGMHGNELMLLHTTGNDGGATLSEYHEIFFLLDVDTGEITIMLDIMGGNRSVAHDPAAGYLYLMQDDGYEYWTKHPGIPVINDPEIEQFTTNTGDRYFVDIPSRKVYKWSNVEIFYKDGSRAGYWIYLKWNADHASVTRYARSIETGEEYLYHEIFN